MTFPTFLGIGAEKCGTTWLHELLSTHPDIYLPTLRKEVHFFDRYYERGVQWYEQFFPAEMQAKQYKAIGEITPYYIHCAECPERIAQMPSVEQVILMVRNPVKRAYSHYWHRVRIDCFNGSFEDFLDATPQAIQWGIYSQSLINYLAFFAKRQILILIFEKAVTDVNYAKYTLANFLNVDVARFPSDVGKEKVNRGYIPRFPALYSKAVYIAARLRQKDSYWLINFLKKFGIKRLFEREATLPPMREETRVRLQEIYANSIKELEEFLGESLECWK